MFCVKHFFFFCCNLRQDANRRLLPDDNASVLNCHKRVLLQDSLERVLRCLGLVSLFRARLRLTVWLYDQLYVIVYMCLNMHYHNMVLWFCGSTECAYI